MRLGKPGISSRFLSAFTIFAEDRRRFGNLCVQARTIALTFYDLCLQYFESQRRHDGIQKTDTGRNRGAHDRRKQRGKLGCHRSRTRLHPGASFGLRRCTLRNYRFGEEALIEGVTALECRCESSFGNGVRVAAINENGGRTVRIYDRLTAQTAYILAVYRYRPEAVEAIERMIERSATERRDTLGTVGPHARITGARFIREVIIGEGAAIDGVSLLENGTVCAGAYVGIDVQARDFIAAEGARIDGGTLLERCFAGECCTLDKHFTAVDSLFFANSHCENGEAVSIFAGPYTVSHHKSSLLIAGMFSFFNAGSGANQSNHLFKSGAVHQAVHLRGCKFASDAYVMSPALEGAFTMVMGHHTHHHDTSDFPFSYLIEKEGRSVLMPGANLASYGTVRDIEKWPTRDHRTRRRDVVNFEAFNPYLTQAMLHAVDTLHTLSDEEPDAPFYNYRKTVIRQTALRRGIALYNKAIAASLGAMLERGEAPLEASLGEPAHWLDVAGAYITRSEVEALCDAIERGELTSPDLIDERFRSFARRYDDHARRWALSIYARLLGHLPSQEEVDEAVRGGAHARRALREMTDADRARDCSPDKAVGYGLDGGEEERLLDYRAVRGLD